MSGPSAVGKDRVLNAAHELWGAQRAVPVTTRSRRADESDGLQYDFVSREQFQAHILDGSIIFWDFLFGYYYGYRNTLIDTCKALSRSEVVMIHCMARMAFRIRREIPDAVLVSLTPGNFDLLDRRLQDRGISGEEVFARQLYRREEMIHSAMFDIVISDADTRETADILREMNEKLS